jgi:hypothetical protein
MAETYLNVRNHGSLTVRLDPTAVRGDGSVARPVLVLPLELQILSIEEEQRIIGYTLLRFAGVLKIKGAETLAEFEAGPLAEGSTPTASYRRLYIEVPLDFPGIKKFEDARAGSDAFISLSLSGLVWLPKEAKFEKITSASDLQFSIPRSTWADRVLPGWGLSNVKLVEIRFPTTQVGDTLRTAYGRVENAEKLFANTLYKQALTELRVGFEALAEGLGFEKRIKDCLEHLLSDLQGERKEKALDAANALYRFLHLGPHFDSGSLPPSEEPRGLRRDARFALVTTLAVFEYITPES